MPKSLAEYIDWLQERGQKWPVPPPPQPVKSVPAIAPLPGIQVVVWNVYGGLLRIADGELRHAVDDELRMQIALEKTIEEFNMWHSMTRKPGAPWKYLHEQYLQLLDDFRLQSSAPRGDFPEVDSADVWKRYVQRLQKKDYTWDVSLYGDLDQLSQKVAYFFHASLQGVEAAPGAVAALTEVHDRRIVQGLLADGQCFTIPQMLRALNRQGKLPVLAELFLPEGVVVSCQEGLRKPSRSLYKSCVERLSTHGFEPDEILYVSNVLRDDLDVAKSFGMHTALLAADRLSLRARAADLRDPACRPDRLMTSLDQIRDIVDA